MLKVSDFILIYFRAELTIMSALGGVSSHANAIAIL